MLKFKATVNGKLVPFMVDLEEQIVYNKNGNKVRNKVQIAAALDKANTMTDFEKQFCTIK